MLQWPVRFGLAGWWLRVRFAPRPRVAAVAG